MARTGLDDPYVRKNIPALLDVESCGAADNRIAAALCRRGLLWEQPKYRWHLTAAGARVLKEWGSEAGEGCIERPPRVQDYPLAKNAGGYIL